MSRIDELLAQYCPDGVEYRILKDVAKIVRGERVTKTELLQNGEYPVVSGGTGYMGYLNKYNREPKTITIAQYGSAGYVNWQTEKFWANDICFSVIPNTNLILNRFLYFFLISKQNYLYKISNKNAIPYSINRERILETNIPVPPLQVQEEIVRILDSFTQLEAELEAELEARRQQYEHYRDSLLDINNPHNPLAGMLTQYCSDVVEQKMLGDLGIFLRGGGPQKKHLLENGKPCIHYGQIYTHYGHYADETISYVSSEIFNSSRKASPGDVIIADASENDEDLAKCVAWLGNEDVAVSNHTLIYRSSLNPKYVSYFLSSHLFQKQKRLYITGVKVKSISEKGMSKIKIPVPPLPVQERIVEILDKFDALVNDLSFGLPAEIQARRQQYEYYRDQLLSFPAAK